MKKLGILVAGLASVWLLGCSGGDPGSYQRSVYLLLDTSGTYAKEVKKAQAITNYLLGVLNSGDSLALARIDSGSFNEKDIIAKVTFDDRPSYANQQKRAFRHKLDRFVSKVKGSRHTDITGGLLQAVEWLNETGAGQKYVLIFSDLEEDVKAGYIRDFALDMTGVQVVALNVTKLFSDQVDPRGYLERLGSWRARVESGGGTWKVINDLDRLDGMINS